MPVESEETSSDTQGIQRETPFIENTGNDAARYRHAAVGRGPPSVTYVGRQTNSLFVALTHT